jgi:hypothetical protein
MRMLMVIVTLITATTVISNVIIGPPFRPDWRFHGLLITGRGTSGAFKYAPSASPIFLESTTTN